MPVAAGGHVGLFHHLPRSLFLRRARLSGHARGSISDIAGMPLLGFLLPCPLAGRGFDGIEMSLAMLRGRVSHRAAPHYR